MAHIIGPRSLPGRSLDVVCGCLAFLLPWALVTSYNLHFFYLSGAATLLDSGWFVALTTHGTGLALPNPSVIRPGSYYAIHVSPLLALLRMLHDVIWKGFDAVWFSAIQGIWYGGIGVATWLALRRATPRLALPAALITALGGVELATLGFPHFEVAMPAILLVFLAVFRDARNFWALLLLPLVLMVREDAGLHAAGLSLLVGLYFVFRTGDSARRAAWGYLILAGAMLAGAVASLAIQHGLFANGYDALGHSYFGQPPLDHVTLPFLKRRLANLALYRLYIFLPVALILGAALRLRDPLLLAGPLACAPWLFLAILAVSEQAGLLCNYYAFPFIIALAWPAICLSLRPWPDKALAWLQVAVGALSIALVPFSRWNADPAPWAHVLPPSWSKIRHTEAVLDSVLAAKASLGTWVADDAAASLRLGAFDENQVVVGFRHSPLQVRQTDALLGAVSPPGWLADRQARMIAASHLDNVYAACGTMLILRTRATLRDAMLLTNLRLVMGGNMALSKGSAEAASRSCYPAPDRVVPATRLSIP